MKKRVITPLIAVLIVLALMCSCSEKENEPTVNESNAAEETENSTQIPFEMPDIASSKEDFLSTADGCTGLWEFLQRFFTDSIVYKNKEGNYTLGTINEKLKPCAYDYDKLIVTGSGGERRIGYKDDSFTSHAGIDVSQYNGEIDWQQVAESGVEFVIVRAGYRGYGTGKLVQDTEFDANVSGALDAGLKVGVYFVTQAISEEEAMEEAKFVEEMIKPYDITYPVVLDIEATSSDEPRTKDLTAEMRTSCIISFCEMVRGFGHTPMLYANIGWYLDYMELDKLDDYPKWFAQYFNRPFFPYDYQIWQYSSSGAVPGIKGNVDLDLAFTDFGKEE